MGADESLTETAGPDMSLEDLEEAERHLSKRRERLHRRIELVRNVGNADGNPASPEQLDALDEEERELSKARRELHRRIAELRPSQT
jgi:hypothetical protein